METRPTQSQTFNINGVSSPKDSASGQCGSETFYAHTKSSHGEGITVLKSLLCLAKAHAQEFIKKGSWTQICAQIKSLLGYVVDNLAHLFLLNKNQTANVLFKRPGFSTSCCVCFSVCCSACVCVRVWTPLPASHRSRRRSRVLWRREDRGEAGRGRRYRQERLTSPRSTHILIHLPLPAPLSLLLLLMWALLSFCNVCACVRAVYIYTVRSVCLRVSADARWRHVFV